MRVEVPSSLCSETLQKLSVVHRTVRIALAPYIPGIFMKPSIHRPLPPAVLKLRPQKQAVTPLLPHERDEFVGEVSSAPDPRLVQAKKDIDAGLVDTDMRATPGLDAARREALVPGAGGKPVQIFKKSQS